MPGRGASGGLAGAQIHKEKLNPKTNPGTAFTAVGFRLIVDD
jgi:hypothetical protein